MKKYLKFISVVMVTCLLVTGYFPTSICLADYTDISKPGVSDVSTSVMPTPEGGYKSSGDMEYTDHRHNPIRGYGVQIGIKVVDRADEDVINKIQDEYEPDPSAGKISVTERYLKQMPSELYNDPTYKKVFIKMDCNTYVGTKDYRVACPWGVPISSMGMFHFPGFYVTIDEPQTSIKEGPIYSIIRNDNGDKGLWKNFINKKLTTDDIVGLLDEYDWRTYGSVHMNFINSWKTYESGIQAMEDYIKADSAYSEEAVYEAQLRYLDLLIQIAYSAYGPGCLTAFKSEFNAYLASLNLPQSKTYTTIIMAPMAIHGTSEKDHIYALNFPMYMVETNYCSAPQIGNIGLDSEFPHLNDRIEWSKAIQSYINNKFKVRGNNNITSAAGENWQWLARMSNTAWNHKEYVWTHISWGWKNGVYYGTQLATAMTPLDYDGNATGGVGYGYFCAAAVQTTPKQISPIQTRRRRKPLCGAQWL